MSRSSIVAIVLFAVALLALLSIGPQATRKIQATFFQTIAPFLKTGSGLERQITSVRSGLKSLEELERENSALRVENRSLKATNEALRDVEHEVNRLRHALNYRERSLFRLVPAEVVSRDSSTWWRTVTINRGEEDGLAPEMPVLTDEGLVGRTTTVSANIAVVLLVSDENCRVAASVEGTREQGIVTGERVAGQCLAAARPQFSFETGAVEAGAEGLYLRRRRRFSLRAVCRHCPQLSSPRSRCPSQARSSG